MTTGDVVFFLQRETWAGIVGRHFGAMGASIVVLAATARIGPVAARNILLDDWETSLGRFVRVMPRDYARALKKIEADLLVDAKISSN